MLRILLIDNNPQDRLLAIRALEKEFLTVQIEAVMDAGSFTLALETGQFDLVITDYKLRWSNGFVVLNAIKSRYPDCPVIMFTNSGTQEIAVEAMKGGLDDYVIKSSKHYIQLVSAVSSVQKKNKTKRKVTDLENRMEGLLNNLDVGIFRQSLDGLILEGNSAFFRLLGLSEPDSYAQNPQSIQSYFQPEDYAKIFTQLQKNWQIKAHEVQLKRADGSLIWVRLSQTENSFAGQTVFDGLIENINECKIAEQERTQLLEELESKQRLLETVLQQIPAALIVAEAASGRIIMMNEQVKTILGGYPKAEQVEDYTNYQYFHLDGRLYQPQELPLARSIRNGEVVCSEEMLVLAGNGSRKTLIVDSSPLRNAEGKIVAGLVIFYDITNQKQVEQALQNALTKLNFHFENTPLGVIERDLDFRIKRWSKSAENIFGWQAEEMIDRDWRAVYVEDVEAVKTLKNRLLKGEEKQNISANRTYTKDGSVVDCEWYNSAVFDEAGNFVSVLSLILDVTARKQVEAELQLLLQQEQAARTEAETANRLKDEFLAVLSHELRSPLNPILGWVKLLRTRKMDESQTSRALETIERNAVLQTQLIEDLLDVSRIMRGKTILKIFPVDLASTIAAATDTVRLSAQAKSIGLKSFFEPNVGLISGDSNRLQQVIWNLLSNAIKFTPNGGCVEIRLERKGRQAQILVSDTGKGIEPGFLPHVFEYFRQADSSTTRIHGGLGLGLAIVRHLVELHGGTVTVSSPGFNLGATFTVSLPLQESSPQQTAGFSDRILDSPHDTAGFGNGLKLETPSSTLIFQGLRILVVDDEADARDFYLEVLQQRGAAVTAVGSVAQAIACLRNQRPDILLSDIGMPIQDGYSLIRQVRALELEQGSRIPAIALTAYARDIDRTEAIAAGFNQHLSKPIEPNELVEAITKLLSQIA